MVSFLLTDLAKVWLYKRFERKVKIIGKKAMAIEKDIQMI
jgi:hypothetical protein